MREECAQGNFGNTAAAGRWTNKHNYPHHQLSAVHYKVIYPAQKDEDDKIERKKSGCP